MKRHVFVWFLTSASSQTNKNYTKMHVLCGRCVKPYWKSINVSNRTWFVSWTDSLLSRIQESDDVTDVTTDGVILSVHIWMTCGTEWIFKCKVELSKFTEFNSTFIDRSKTYDICRLTDGVQSRRPKMTDGESMEIWENWRLIACLVDVGIFTVAQIDQTYP